MANKKMEVRYKDWSPDQPLLDAQWELYVTKVITGMHKEKASVESGYNKKWSYELDKNPYIRARMVYLQTLAAEEATVSVSWWLKRMKAIADSDVTDVVKWLHTEDEQGNSKPCLEAIESDLLPEYVRQSIKKVKITYSMLGDSMDIEFQMHDKLAALKTLGDYLGVTGKDAKPPKNLDGVARQMDEDEGRSLTNEDLDAIRRLAWKT